MSLLKWIHSHITNTCYLVLSANIQKVWNDNDACNAHSKRNSDKRREFIVLRWRCSKDLFIYYKDGLSLSRSMCYYAPFWVRFVSVFFLHVFRALSKYQHCNKHLFYSASRLVTVMPLWSDCLAREHMRIITATSFIVCKDSRHKDYIGGYRRNGGNEKQLLFRLE